MVIYHDRMFESNRVGSAPALMFWHGGFCMDFIRIKVMMRTRENLEKYKGRIHECPKNVLCNSNEFMFDQLIGNYPVNQPVAAAWLEHLGFFLTEHGLISTGKNRYHD